jgi:hypothetical protein
MGRARLELATLGLKVRAERLRLRATNGNSLQLPRLVVEPRCSEMKAPETSRYSRPYSRLSSTDDCSGVVVATAWRTPTTFRAQPKAYARHESPARGAVNATSALDTREWVGAQRRGRPWSRSSRRRRRGGNKWEKEHQKAKLTTSRTGSRTSEHPSLRRPNRLRSGSRRWKRAARKIPRRTRPRSRSCLLRTRRRAWSLTIYRLTAADTSGPWVRSSA